MRIHRADTQGERVLVVVGDVGPAHVDELLVHLLDTVTAAPCDVLLDARQVTGFDVTALRALAGAQSQARSQGQRFAVVDRDDGLVTAALRRSDPPLRLAVFPDLAVAHEALAEPLAPRKQAPAGRDARPESIRSSGGR